MHKDKNNKVNHVPNNEDKLIVDANPENNIRLDNNSTSEIDDDSYEVKLGKTEAESWYKKIKITIYGAIYVANRNLSKIKNNIVRFFTNIANLFNMVDFFCKRKTEAQIKSKLRERKTTFISKLKIKILAHLRDQFKRYGNINKRLRLMQLSTSSLLSAIIKLFKKITLSLFKNTNSTNKLHNSETTESALNHSYNIKATFRDISTQLAHNKFNNDITNKTMLLASFGSNIPFSEQTMYKGLSTNAIMNIMYPQYNNLSSMLQTTPHATVTFNDVETRTESEFHNSTRIEDSSIVMKHIRNNTRIL